MAFNSACPVSVPWLGNGFWPAATGSTAMQNISTANIVVKRAVLLILLFSLLALMKVYRFGLVRPVDCHQGDTGTLVIVFFSISKRSQPQVDNRNTHQAHLEGTIGRKKKNFKRLNRPGFSGDRFT